MKMSEDLTPDLARMREVAEKALTEIVGDWRYLDIGELVLDETSGDPDEDLAVIATLSEDLPDMEAVGEFLAAANPAAVLYLLDRIAELEGERDAVEAVLNHAGAPTHDGPDQGDSGPIAKLSMAGRVDALAAANERLARLGRAMEAERNSALDRADTLQGEVDGLREAASWQDISTAPLDGTHILLAFGSDGVTLGWWDDREPGPYPWKFVDRGAPGSTGHAAGGFINGSREVRGGPTHWRFAPSGPLSQPPADEAAKGEA